MFKLGFLKFLKGTPVRHKHQEHGFKFDAAPPYQIIESNYLSKEELEEIVNLEHALEIYWNDKRATNTLKYVCNKYGIFDFLIGLGSYFKQVSDFHKFSLFDIYQILNDYSVKQFPQDIVLKELIAVDYYLHFKVKPKELILSEIPKNKKFELINKLGLNHHKYRFVMLPLSFNFKLAQNQNIIEKQNQTLIIQYNGSSKAELLTEVV
jgi:hypothetical protein